jgi:post-segregation antitoxin (ccd killing protein)
MHVTQTLNVKRVHALGREWMRMRMSKKRNVVLYLDQEIVEKSRELGFNLSKTFENHLKHLINRLENLNSTKNYENNVIGSPEEIRTPVSGSRARHA